MTGTSRRVGKRPLPALGWREWIELPELPLPVIKAKVDTGARSSALHAVRIAYRSQGEQTWVDFVVAPHQHDSMSSVECTAPLVDERWVRSSNGRKQLRPVIRTALRLGDDVWPVDVTLAGRDLMGFRMLLGREAIRRRYVVDPSRSFLSFGLDPRT